MIQEVEIFLNDLNLLWLTGKNIEKYILQSSSTLIIFGECPEIIDIELSYFECYRSLAKMLKELRQLLIFKKNIPKELIDMIYIYNYRFLSKY